MKLRWNSGGARWKFEDAIDNLKTSFEALLKPTTSSTIRAVPTPRREAKIDTLEQRLPSFQSRPTASDGAIDDMGQRHRPERAKQQQRRGAESDRRIPQCASTKETVLEGRWRRPTPAAS